MWSHRRQPTRLPHPWDSPGKNTGVGCHFLLHQLLQLCLTLCNPMDSPGKNTGVDFHALLQGIFPIQGSHPCLLQLLCYRQIILPADPPGKPPPNFTVTVFLLLTAKCIDSRAPWISILALAEKKLWFYARYSMFCVSFFLFKKGGCAYASRAQVLFQSCLLHERYKNLLLEGLNQQVNNLD